MVCSKQLEDTLNKIDTNIKTVQSGKLPAKEMMKPMISARKELMITNGNTTKLGTFNNQVLYDAKKLYYDETNNIWHASDKVLDWLDGIALGDTKITDTTILDNYKKEIDESIGKIKNTELTVRKVESESWKKSEQ